MTRHCRSMVLAIFLFGLSSGWLLGWNGGAAAQGDAAAAQRIVHKRSRLRWEDGFPLGNGDAGVMLWGDGGPLALTLDKADLWDLLQTDGGLRVLLQSIPDGPAYAVAWNATGPDFFLAIESAASAAEAVAKAKATRDGAAAQGFDALHAEHVQAWAKFWSGAAVYLPEPRISANTGWAPTGCTSTAISAGRA